MIESLHISNYALIETLDIRLYLGLNIITGETGAGKSIILGALGLLMGERADLSAMRSGEEKTVIEATFTATGETAIEEFCKENDIDWSDDSIILRREITSSGRSRAFINDCPVNLAKLQTVALQLIDIHSQHQNLLLASPPYQRRIIDSLAANDAGLMAYSTLYSEYRSALRRYSKEKRSIEQTRADEDFLRFQYEKLAEANLQAGELDELEHERDHLSNISDLRTTLESLTEALSDGEYNAIDLLREAEDRCADAVDLIEDANDLQMRLANVRIELQDIADTFAGHNSELNADPERLEAIEARISQLSDLLRRHGVETIEELIAVRDSLAEKLEALDSADELLRQYAKAAKEAKVKATRAAEQISARRKATAEEFARILKERAVPLGMNNLCVSIEVTSTELSPTGADAVDFKFAFNKNQQLLPVGKTASGGEISRLMLSIKSIVADKMRLPSIIFDEVDTGVSGDLADRMGALMKQISQNIQVIAITHLPQVASKGAHHFKVFKHDTEQATVTRILELNNDERISELAAMLSGSIVNDAAIANAKALLEANAD